MKNKLLKYKIGFFLLSFLFFFGLLMNVYINTDKELADVPDKIIRLHVVANSDSPLDQQLKLQVRDKVISSMNERFKGIKDIAEVKNIITGSLEEIEAIAKEIIKEKGSLYDVKAAFATTEFPTKTYGNLTLPAGTYQALNIVIGEGKGKNWWCVMFPPLCFIDVAHGVVPEKTMKELKNALTAEEYRLLLSSRTEEEIPVKLRFKVLELAKSVNLRLARLGKMLD
ncbi:MAG TPA: stage II sporulation protein R [Clostridia bacterium]|nr:stage II sporulation protein R [Clostridia bacterium]